VRMQAHAEIRMLGPAVILARSIDLAVFTQQMGSLGSRRLAIRSRG
jgi:hypothetical protein